MLVNLLNAIFAIMGGYIAITYLFPMLKDFLAGAIKDKVSLEGLMGVLNLYVIVFVLAAVVKELVAINNQYLNYVNVLSPALIVMVDLIPYLKYLVLGVLVIIGINSFKKKR